MKIHVISTGKTTIDADAEYQEPQVREALAADAAGEAEPGFIPFSIIDVTDSERSDISHDEYATVTEDDGTELWRGWLNGLDGPGPLDPAALPVAVRALRAIAISADVGVVAIDPTDVADEALTALMRLGVDLKAVTAGQPS